VLVVLPVALVVISAQVATADPTAADGVSAERFSFGVAGPVGIVAVALGLGGLVLGLLRHRRNAAARAAAALLEARRTPTPEPAHSDSAA
jgi:hypothetical protein